MQARSPAQTGRSPRCLRRRSARKSIGRCSGHLDVALRIAAGVLDLLQQHDAFGHRRAIGVAQQRVDIAIDLRRGWPRSLHDQNAGHAGSDLQGGRAVTVRMVPERSGRVGGRDIEFVLEADPWIDTQQDIIAVAARIDPKSVRMKVGSIEAIRRIEILVVRRAVRFGRQLVVQRDADRLAWKDLHGRRHERYRRRCCTRASR